MVPRVLGARFQLQVFEGIIRFVFISVVNNLIRLKKPPELVLNQHSMERVEALRISFRVRWVGTRVPIPTAKTRRENGEQGTRVMT